MERVKERVNYVGCRREKPGTLELSKQSSIIIIIERYKYYTISKKTAITAIHCFEIPHIGLALYIASFHERAGKRKLIQYKYKKRKGYKTEKRRKAENRKEIESTKANKGTDRVHNSYIRTPLYMYTTVHLHEYIYKVKHRIQII